MKKNLIIIAPDSFKGSLTAAGVAEAVDCGVTAADCGFKTIKLPVADGGEGTVSAICGNKIKEVTVSGPIGIPVSAYYGEAPDGGAVIELSACAGLPQTPLRDPSKTTTYGVGELICRAIEDGYKKITVGLGGSCTNDGGCGLAAALGVRFYDPAGKAFVPTGETLSLVSRIDKSGIIKELAEGYTPAVTLQAMCDITNPLCGEQGAAYVFAPQKGADAAMIEMLDSGLRHLSEIIKRDLGKDVSELPGGGAAGGCGAGIAAFLGGALYSGIDAVLDLTRFDSYLPEAVLVITGEGHFDSQSICGKVADGIARRTSVVGVPLVVLTGGADHVPESYAKGITAVFPVLRGPCSLSRAKHLTASNIALTTENLVRLFDTANRYIPE